MARSPAPAEALPANVLLVGDAGGFSDPLTGEGIYGAIASGQAAAAAVLASAEKGDSARSSLRAAYAPAAT